MRDAAHYSKMMSDNPSAGVGFTLAASAVYAARYRICEAERHGTEEWRAIARDLKNRYGETLNTDAVVREMAISLQ
jgi:hypothetical protein